MITQVTVTTTAAVIFSSDKNEEVLLQNDSDTDWYIKYDRSVTALTSTNGVLLPAGTERLFTDVNKLWALHAGSGSKTGRLSSR